MLNQVERVTSADETVSALLMIRLVGEAEVFLSTFKDWNRH